MAKAIFKYDPQAVQKLKEKLEKLEKLQAKMKAANKAIRKGDDAALIELGFSELQIQNLKTPDWCGRIGFADFSITNNGAEIRRVKKRIEQVAKEQARECAPAECVMGDNPAAVVDNPERGSTELIFIKKPSEHVLSRLKLCGWRYAPSTKVWYKQRRDDYTLKEAKTIAELKVSNEAQ